MLPKESSINRWRKGLGKYRSSVVKTGRQEDSAGQAPEPNSPPSSEAVGGKTINRKGQKSAHVVLLLWPLNSDLLSALQG